MLFKSIVLEVGKLLLSVWEGAFLPCWRKEVKCVRADHVALPPNARGGAVGVCSPAGEGEMLSKPRRAAT